MPRELVGLAIVTALAYGVGACSPDVVALFF